MRFYSEAIEPAIRAAEKRNASPNKPDHVRYEAQRSRYLDRKTDNYVRGFVCAKLETVDGKERFAGVALIED